MPRLVVAIAKTSSWLSPRPRGGHRNEFAPAPTHSSTMVARRRRDVGLVTVRAPSAFSPTVTRVLARRSATVCPARPSDHRRDRATRDRHVKPRTAASTHENRTPARAAPAPTSVVPQPSGVRDEPSRMSAPTPRTRRSASMTRRQEEATAAEARASPTRARVTASRRSRRWRLSATERGATVLSPS